MKNTDNITQKNNKQSPPYLLGFLGLIPLIGFFVGLGLLLYGIIKYKDKKLIVIGISCMLFTIIAYSALFYFGFVSEVGKRGRVQVAQTTLNSLIRHIEYYKIENGHYPDSLQELKNKDAIVFMSDPLRAIERNENINFNYKNIGNKYLLYSSGIDGIANTKDDVYPKVDTSNKNIGWAKSE